jgi:hypothetical protein
MHRSQTPKAVHSLLKTMLNAAHIVALHDELTRRWHVEAIESWLAPANPWSALVAKQHLANFELWHTEDAARIPDATDADITRLKHRIDETNQRRNDLSEQIDQKLLDSIATKSLPNPDAPLNSESPGLIIDRLSILALKLFHTREEVARSGAPAGHSDRNRQRLAILEHQRKDLAQCLTELWSQTLSGERQFKLYRQLKMYNDPALNPAVYSGKTSSSRS